MRAPSAAVLAVVLVGCTPPDEDRRRDRKDPEPQDTAPLVDTSTRPDDTGRDTATPTDTGPEAPWFDCGDTPPPPFDVDVYDLTTEEDFDFDALGYLIYQEGVDLAGRDLGGDFKIIAPNASMDPAGIQVLSTGDIAVASPDSSSLRLFDANTGGYQTIVSNVTQLNGLEIGANDRIYYSEMTTDGRVGWVDPYTGAQGIVIDHIYTPNGLALSPDEQTLYIAGGASVSDSYVFAVDLVGPDTWSEPRVVLEATDDTYDAIEVDSCGVVYTTGFSNGKVLRTFPAFDFFTEPIANLGGQGGWGSFSSMRFGNGVGGWDLDTLYITNRNDVFALHVNTPGRPHPTNPNPAP